jgi:LEA14-like dessication related protein
MRHHTHRSILAVAAAALLAGLAGLTGCAAVNDLARAAFQRPTLAFEKVEVQALDFDGATLALDYRLTNPNPFGLTLARVQYWLQLDGRIVTRGEIAGGLRIPASGTAPVRFTARLPFAEVPRLLELVQRHGPVAYAVGGQVAVDTPVGVLELPVEHAGTVDLPALPALRIASVSVQLASLSELRVDVALLVRNPNPFPLPEGSFRYALAADGEVVATSELEGMAAVPPGGEARIDVPIRLSLIGAGRAAMALRGGGATVRLTGEGKVGAIPFPIDVVK